MREALVLIAGTVAPSALTIAHIRAVCDYCTKAKSVAYQRALQWELRKFVLTSGADAEILGGLHRLPAARPRETTAPRAEVDAVLRTASNRLTLAIILARDAALRRSAIERFNIRNCDFDMGEVVGVSKGWSTYRVPMTKRLRDLLVGIAQLAKGSEPFIQTVDNHHRAVNACTLLWELRRTQKSIGLAMPAWGLHDLRRTAARELYTYTGDIRKVQRLLGHSSPVCTWNYIGQLGLPLSAADLERETA